MPPPFVIVWDLDLTLGAFDTLEGAQSDQLVTVKLRPDIEQALVRLSGEGFAHTVLTLATPGYAELALRGTGLRDHFFEVAGAGQRNKGDVDGIAALVGIPPAECPHRMLFVGDHPLLDAPRGHRVVFHVELDALSRSALDLCELVHAMREAGDGSLARGFDAVAERGTTVEGARRVALDGIGRLLMVPSAHSCQVVAFEDDGGATATPVAFSPGSVAFHPAASA